MGGTVRVVICSELFVAMLHQANSLVMGCVSGAQRGGAGASVGAANKDGRASLGIAAAKGHEASVLWLLEGGPRVDGGRAPLRW